MTTGIAALPIEAHLPDLKRILQVHRNVVLAERTGVGLVIFDEFHERRIHADTGLVFCLDIQEGLRPDLRLLVMSATLDTEGTSRLLGNTPIIQSQGRQFPVKTRYWPGSTALSQAAPVDKRKIVLSTSIAETSLTIEGIQKENSFY